VIWERTLEQMVRYGWEKAPRIFGNPIQVIVQAMEDLRYRVSYSITNEKSCFISHNSYPKIVRETIYDKRSGQWQDSFVPKLVRLECVIFDFDDDDKPENALIDCRNLSMIADELEADWSSQYSGGKGFHFIWKLEPTVYRFEFPAQDDPPGTISTADQLKKMVFTFQDWFNSFCQFKTYDSHLNSDVKRIIRMPYTPHVSRKGKVSGRYCIPLSRDMLRNWNIQQIIEASYSPTYEMIQSSGGHQYRIEEIISFLGAKPIPDNQFNKPLSSFVPVNDIDVNLVLQMIARRDCMCIWNELQKRNPKHQARIYFVLFVMCYLDMYDTFQINELWEKFGAVFNYDDLYNVGDRLIQIRSIAEKPKYKNNPIPHRCDTLKEYKLCLGTCQLCPKYRS